MVNHRMKNDRKRQSDFDTLITLNIPK